jgi:hypothetical protein
VPNAVDDGGGGGGSSSRDFSKRFFWHFPVYIKYTLAAAAQTLMEIWVSSVRLCVIIIIFLALC